MYFSLVLHAHIPFCRKSGTWPAGEEWLHEAIIDSYLPMLRVLGKLKSISIKPSISIDFTPVLLEQLADHYMQDKFIKYLEELIIRSRKDIVRFHDIEPLRKLSEYYLAEYEYYLDMYKNKIRRDIIGAFRRFEQDGMIEIFTSAATHGFLPLLERDSSIWAQVKMGVDVHEKYFGKKPVGMWLPECAFRPLEFVGDRAVAGLDHWLRKAGIKYFIVNYTGIDDARIVRVNPDGVSYTSTYEGYRLDGTGVCVLGRNYATSERVWSAEVGYPGNSAYREFHLKDPVSGLRYHAVSGKFQVKNHYSLREAMSQVKTDALDFTGLIRENLKDYKKINGRDGIIVAPYDFELFGHWWYEGPSWIEELFMNLSKVDDVDVMMIKDYIKENEKNFSEIILERTSWGEGGDFRVWNSKEQSWMWPYINSCASDLEKILRDNEGSKNELTSRVLKQMARELLLMEGSDWPFLLYTNQAADYANQRFHWHHQRFNILSWAAKDFNDKNRLDLNFLSEIEEIDNCFQDVNLEYFKKMDD
ncbi:MAG: 1,4-alpha-glucan branching protein domain-containing protein [Promethearchaeota archaeon]